MPITGLVEGSAGPLTVTGILTENPIRCLLFGMSGTLDWFSLLCNDLYKALNANGIRMD